MAVRKAAANNEKKITILRPCLKFLQFHCLWPKTNEEFSPGIGYTIKAFTPIAFAFFLTMTGVLHIIYVKTNKLDVKLYNDVVVIINGLIVGLVSLELYLKQNQYADLLLQLCDYKFGRPKDLDRIESLLSYLSKGFYLFIFLGITAYGLIPIMEQSRCEKYFKVKEIEEFCGSYIPTPPWLVPKMYSSTFKRVVFGMQMFAALVSVCPAGMHSVLMFEMNVHMVVHMKHLKSKIEALSLSEDIKKELYTLVKYHQHIIALMHTMNKCFSRVLCVHAFLTSTMLGCILNQIMNLTWESPIGPLYHLFSWTISLFLNSLGGDIILNEGISIGTALYFSDWLELDQSLKKDMLVIIERTQKALLLKTGPFGCMSLGGFVSILKGLHTLTTTLMSR